MARLTEGACPASGLRPNENEARTQKNHCSSVHRMATIFLITTQTHRIFGNEDPRLRRALRLAARPRLVLLCCLRTMERVRFSSLIGHIDHMLNLKTLMKRRQELKAEPNQLVHSERSIH
jgi:hypothetical protein